MGRTDPVIHHGDLKEHDALNNVKVHQILIFDFTSSADSSKDPDGWPFYQ